MQVTTITGAGMSMTYNDSATQNNGRIASSVDGITNETITYQYDALKRQVAANGRFSSVVTCTMCSVPLFTKSNYSPGGKPGLRTAMSLTFERFAAILS